MSPDLFLFSRTCPTPPACGLSFPMLWAFQHPYNRPPDPPSHALQNLLGDHKSESRYCCLVRVMCAHVHVRARARARAHTHTHTHTHSWCGGRWDGRALHNLHSLGSQASLSQETHVLALHQPCLTVTLGKSPSSGLSLPLSKSGLLFPAPFSSWSS